jgi:hypothetical protein
MNLEEQELQRARWRRSLARFGLEQTGSDAFAMGGLTGRLDSVSVQMLLLPGDPEAEAIRITEAFSSWLEAQRSLDLDGLVVQLPSSTRRTAHAIALADQYGDDSWSSYLAVHRSGALEFGLGSAGGWEGRDRDGSEVRVIALTSTVARAWALLHVAAALGEKTPIDGPFLLTVAVPHADSALLGALGEGWAQPGDFQNRVGPCRDSQLMWHFELTTLPEGDDAKQLAYAIGDRLEDAWGCPQRRYLAHRGQYQGRLDPRVA